MRLAIMQPYLFPYIGYLQLVAAVDRFVVYDDVSFIKNGWINRNRILGGPNGAAPAYITAPLDGASSSKPIREVGVSLEPRWRSKRLKMVAQTYGRAPCFREVFPLVEAVLGRGDRYIGAMAVASLRAVCGYLDLSPDWVASSSHYGNDNLHGQARVLDICRREQATEYINPIGGIELYTRAAFADHGVALRFLKPRLTEYAQLGAPFVPGLSILDVLMFNPPARAREMLHEFDLV
jgi:WbqC-like protein family